MKRFTGTRMVCFQQTWKFSVFWRMSTWSVSNVGHLVTKWIYRFSPSHVCITLIMLSLALLWCRLLQTTTTAKLFRSTSLDLGRIFIPGCISRVAGSFRMIVPPAALVVPGLGRFYCLLPFSRRGKHLSVRTINSSDSVPPHYWTT